MTNNSQVLSGWKEIAEYMHMGVRTVQRYEHDQGLPIHHPVPRHVITTRTELDEWVDHQPKKLFSNPYSELEKLQAGIVRDTKLVEEIQQQTRIAMRHVRNCLCPELMAALK